MSTLKIRKPPFTFDPESTPYIWQSKNPDFAEMCNAISFAAPAFENYIVQVVQLAAPRLAGTPMQQEAEDFLRQEAQHARMHRRHAAVLVQKYPGLAATLQKLDQAYADLIENESLEFNLAYITDIEATFTPFFGMLLNNEKVLFRGGAEHISSLFLWHFMEEIEHRSSAFGIYETAVGKPWHRVRVMPKVWSHIIALMKMVVDDFIEHVPASDRAGATGDSMGFRSQALQGIPRAQMATMVWRLALSQAPFHRPERQHIPTFSAEWYGAESRGKDITRWYSDSGA